MALYKVYEDSSFTTGETNRVLDVLTDLGKKAISGYIVNNGSGTMQFQMDLGDGAYGDSITLYAGEGHNFGRNFPDSWEGRYQLSKLKLIWVSDTSYKVYVD